MDTSIAATGMALGLIAVWGAPRWRLRTDPGQAEPIVELRTGIIELFDACGTYFMRVGTTQRPDRGRKRSMRIDRGNIDVTRNLSP